MIKVVGTSKININLLALEELLNNILPDGFTDEMEVKMDARGNVKSTFMKIDTGSVAKCSVYTGAIETEWDAQFVSTDNVKSQQEALIFVATFAVKKFLAKVKYNMKLANMPNIRVEDDFAEIRGLIDALTQKYEELAPLHQGSVPSKSSLPGSPKTPRTKTQANPNAGVPLEDTPQADIPEDLDLLGITPAPVEESNITAVTETENTPVEELNVTETSETENTPVKESASEEVIANEDGGLNLDAALEEVSVQDETEEEVEEDLPLI